MIDVPCRRAGGLGLEAVELPRQRSRPALVVWALAACVAAACADALLASIGTALMGRPGALSGGVLLTPLQHASFFAGTSIVRLAGLLPMLGLVCLAHGLLPKGGLSRWLGLAALSLAATAVGWAIFDSLHCSLGRQLGYEARLAQVCSTTSIPPHWVPVLLAGQAQFALLMVGLYEFVLRSHGAEQALHEAGLRRLGLAGELAAGRAHLLQAQIEPHFLFNSLANVRRLVRTDPKAAAAMLADLLRYLREALPRLRETDVTLSQEVELVRAYLDVHAVRMGPRLHYEIDAPEDLAAAPMPPMLLLTLVENALKHGLHPLPEGGSIRVAARRSDGVLTLTVGDTGRGMGEGSGHGMGLANVMARLRSLYGARAALSLHVNEPRGVLATITLPIAAARAAP